MGKKTRRLPVTPGPWLFEPGTNTGSGGYITRGKYAQLVTRDADGHLIAAAPELYEALRAIVDVVSVGPSGEVCQAFDFDRARAALAKAEGR